MILRPYQLDLACEVIAVHECMTRKVLAVLPTGGGKSTIIGFAALHDTGNIWVIAHRQELIRQLSGTLTRFDLPHGIVKSGYPFDPTQRIQVASIQTLVKRHHLLPEPAMIIVDEAHHATSKSYTTVTDSYPKSRVLGACANREAQNRAGLKILIALGNGGYCQWEPEVPGSANREAQNGAGLFSFCRLRRGLSVFIVSLSFCFVVYRRAS